MTRGEASWADASLLEAARRYHFFSIVSSDLKIASYL